MSLLFDPLHNSCGIQRLPRRLTSEVSLGRMLQVLCVIQRSTDFSEIDKDNSTNFDSRMC